MILCKEESFALMNAYNDIITELLLSPAKQQYGAKKHVMAKCKTRKLDDMITNSVSHTLPA
eukprot:scaffold41965_cov19-Prasinocladus_malaysianus.AAC.1